MTRETPKSSFLKIDRRFDLSDAVADAYTAASKLVNDPLTTAETYRNAVISYFRWCVHFGVYQEGALTAMVATAESCHDREVLRSVLFRINCQALQHMIGEPECRKPCCCACPGWPDDKLECVREFWGDVVLDMRRRHRERQEETVWRKHAN